MKTYLEKLQELPVKTQVKELQKTIKQLKADGGYDIDKEHQQDRLRIIEEYKNYLNTIMNKKTFVVTWDERHSVTIKAENEQEALDRVNEGDFLPENEGAEMNRNKEV